MAAAKALSDSGSALRGDVLVAAVADEEYGSLGTSDLLARVRTDGAIVTEPTALEVCLAHKGYLWIEVQIAGRAAHGSKFELGIDANMKMGHFLHAPQRTRSATSARARRIRWSDRRRCTPRCSTAAADSSTYAALCTLQIERRTIPGETEAQAVAEIQAIADRSRRDRNFRATVKPFFVRDPFEVAATAAIVRAVDRAAAQVRGRPAAHIGDTPWMDAALLQAAGVETVVSARPEPARTPTSSGSISIRSARWLRFLPTPPSITANSYNNGAVTRLRLALAILFGGIAWGAAPSYSAAKIVSTGSYAAGPFAPNSLITIFGEDLSRARAGSRRRTSAASRCPPS